MLIIKIEKKSASKWLKSNVIHDIFLRSVSPGAME